MGRIKEYRYGRWISILLFVCLLFLFPADMAGAGAEGDQPAQKEPLPLTLAEAIDLALKQNVAIRAARQEMSASEYRKKSTRTGFWPKFSATSSFTLSEHAPEVNNMPMAEKEDYQVSVAVEQPLYTGGALTNSYSLSGLALETSGLQYEEQVQEIIYRVRERYLSVLKAMRAKEVTEQEVAQLKAHVETAQALYDSGMIIKADLLEVMVQMANSQQRLTSAQNTIEVARASLNSLLGLDLEADFRLEEVLHYTPHAFELPKCFQDARKLRPELQKAAKDITQAELSVNMARSDYYPKLSLVGSYELSKEPFSFSSDENARLMARLTWTFWEWKKTDYDVAEARVRVSQAEDNFKLIEDAVILEVKQAFLKLREAEENITVARKAIDQAEENYRINLESFKVSTATSTDLLDAETLLAQTKLNYYTGLFDYNLALAALERAIGLTGK
ncbi:MAG: TolC family protein [bacterium]